MTQRSVLERRANQKRRNSAPPPLIAAYMRRQAQGGRSTEIKPIYPNPGAQARLFFDILGFEKGKKKVIEYPKRTTEDAKAAIAAYDISYPYDEVLEDSAVTYELVRPEVFKPKATTINVHCGNGFGKTAGVGGGFIRMMTEINPTGRGLISANTYPQLEKATLVALIEFFLRFNVPFYPWKGPDYLRGAVAEGRELEPGELTELTMAIANTATHIAHYKKWMLVNGVRHDVISADAYQGGSNSRKQSGRGAQYSHLLLDEYARTPDASAFQTLVTRNRLKGNAPPIILITSTPNTDGLNWVYEMFDNPVLTEEQLKGKASLEGSSIENRHYNDESYVANMFSNMPKEMFLAEVFGKYVEFASNRLIEEAWIEAAIKIELRREKPPIMADTINHNLRIGLDIANSTGESGDDSVLTLIDGATVADIQEYRLDTYKLAEAVDQYAKDNHVGSVCYDGDGLGVGTGNDLTHIEGRQYSVFAARGSRRASQDELVTDFKGNKIKARDLFANERAELGWVLRERFKKTYAVMSGAAEYPDHELISIPDNPELKRQIRAIKYIIMSNKKVILLSKEEIIRQLGRSPDHYDSLAYAFAAKIDGAVADTWWNDVY